MKRAFLLVALIVSPNIVFGDGYNIGELKKQILDAQNPVEASKLLTDLSKEVHNAHTTAKGELKKSLETKVTDAITAYKAEVKPTDTRTKEQKEADLEKKQQAYEDAKANEQSTANKTLTAATTAAMGIGAMELLQGRAEQKADKEAEAAMDALIATMRCTYAEGKQVKAGPDEIELPGGNNSELMKYRAEYLALAADLKERKTALGMKAGIESEEIFDKATIGLYDDENTGMTSGAYESLYRAKMLGSETDQKKIDDMASTSKKRVVGGAIAAGAGALVGVVGNSLINGKLGEKLKEKKKKTELTEEKAKKIVPDEKADTKISKSAITAEGEEYKYIKSFNLNDTCSYETQTEAIEGSEELDLCEGLQKGEWLAKFSYGIVKGRASCNTTEGNSYCDHYSHQPQNSKCVKEQIERSSFEKPSDAFSIGSTGKYCWCQTTNIGSSSSNWVFVGDEYKDEASCTQECAILCADLFNAPEFQEFTKEILSSVN